MARGSPTSAEVHEREQVEPDVPAGPGPEVGSAVAPDAHETADLAPSAPATALGGETPPEAPPVPPAVADDIEAEVRSMSVTDLADELRKRDLKIPTTKAAKVEALLKARLLEAATETPAVG